MLKSYDWKYTPLGSNKTYYITIVDDDFTETIMASNYWEATVLIYEEKGLDVARNLVRGMTNGIDRKQIHHLYGVVSRCTNGKYDKEMEKYLVLI
jgi:hypothetical protein